MLPQVAGAPSVVVGVTAVSLSLALLTWVWLTAPRSNKQVITNLRRGLEREQETTAPLVKTADDRQESRLHATALRLTPAGMVRTLERLHSRAGRPPEWPVPRLVAGKLVLLLAAALLSLIYLNSAATPLSIMVCIVIMVVAYFLPELLLHSRAQERNEKIQLELADTLDQMTIAVEAGLGFDGALAKAGRNGKGPLAEELVRTLQDIQVGHSRREAYTSLANRTDVADLRRFIRAVIQADTYGIAIADVLRTQAAEMRMKRRQRAEEKAMQIPVKVIFPLMLCILPVLFIVLLGPAVMDIIAAFG